jgi:hypothetical protein
LICESGGKGHTPPDHFAKNNALGDPRVNKMQEMCEPKYQVQKAYKGISPSQINMVYR